MFLQDLDGYCTVYCVCVASEFFSFFGRWNYSKAVSDAWKFRATSSKPNHFQISPIHCAPPVFRYRIPQDIAPYKDELGEWHPPRISGRYKAERLSCAILRRVTFGNGLTFFICQTGGVFSLIGKGTPQDKKRPWDFQAVLILDVIFFGDVFLDFNPFGCYMNHEKNKHHSFLGGFIYVATSGWLSGSTSSKKWGAFQDSDHGETQQKGDNFPGKLLTFWMNRLMSLTKIFGEKGAFKVLFAPNLYCWFSTCRVTYEFCQSPTVDGSEIHNNHPTCMKPCTYMHINHINRFSRRISEPRIHSMSQEVMGVSDFTNTYLKHISHWWATPCHNLLAAGFPFRGQQKTARLMWRSNTWWTVYLGYLGSFSGGGWWPKVRIYVILGGGFKYFLFSPQPGELIHFD